MAIDWDAVKAYIDEKHPTVVKAVDDFNASNSGLQAAVVDYYPGSRIRLKVNVLLYTGKQETPGRQEEIAANFIAELLEQTGLKCRYHTHYNPSRLEYELKPDYQAFNIKPAQ